MTEPRDPQSPAAQQPPMGWYADPSNPAQERYWEGTRWTHNVREPQANAGWSAGLGHREERTSEPSAPTTEALAPPGQADARAGQRDLNAPSAGPQESGPITQAGPGVWVGQYRPATSDGVPLASFWARLAARVIDNVVVSLLTLPLAWGSVSEFWTIIQSAATTSPQPSQQQINAMVQDPAMAYSWTWLGVWFAYQLLAVGLAGRTVGKQFLGLRVAPFDHGRQARPGWPRAMARAALVTGLGLLDAVMLVASLVASLAMLSKPRCQALQDRFSGTQVVSRPRLGE